MKKAEPLKAGDEIGGRFRIQRILGRGGMGVVYLAQDMRRGQPVALKTILPQYRYVNRAIARFTREVIALRDLQHPGIVRFHVASQDRTHDLVYFTMEYIEGVTLRQHLNTQGRLSLERTLEVLLELCSAVQHVHTRTLHRDISPENVMITPEGRVKLLDFGLAKVPDPDFAPFTLRGECLGRLQYTPPEQKLDASTVDHRVDIFAMGVLFFELLTADISKLGRPLSVLRPDLPAECDKFLLEALAPKREERIASAQEFIRGLNRLHVAAVRREKGSIFDRIIDFVRNLAQPGRRRQVAEHARL